MVYKNIEDARQALNTYNALVTALQREMGVTEECEDSCCATFAKVRYYDIHASFAAGEEIIRELTL